MLYTGETLSGKAVRNTKDDLFQEKLTSKMIYLTDRSMERVLMI